MPKNSIEEDKAIHKAFQSGDVETGSRLTLEKMIRDKQRAQEQEAAQPEKDFDRPFNLNPEELIKATERVLENKLPLGFTPIWAIPSVRTSTDYKHNPYFKQVFYDERGRKYFDEVNEFSDELEEAYYNPEVYPAFYRPTCNPFFDGYQPCYEEQWFWPLNKPTFDSLRKDMDHPSPLTPGFIAGYLAEDAVVAYATADGRHIKFSEDPDAHYKHTFTKYKDESTLPDELKEIEYQFKIPDYNLNSRQNAAAFYVGLNTLQRAVALWAVNELLIPMLNADDVLPGFYAFLPDMTGHFVEQNTWSDANVFFGGDPMDSYYKDTISANTRIRNKSIILRQALRTNQIIVGYNKDLSNEELVELIEANCYPENAWTLPPWDEHIIPDSPAEKFFEHAMSPERNERPRELFGRGILWDRTGYPRAGLMHALDLTMMSDALILATQLDRLYDIEVVSGRMSETFEEMSVEVSDWFGAIGKLHKSINHEVPYPTLRERKIPETGYNGVHYQPEDIRNMLLKYRKRACTFYDYNNRDIADFVYDEIATMYEEDSKKFTTRILDHIEALRLRVVAEQDDDPKLGPIAARELAYREKSRNIIQLPFGYALPQREVMWIVRKLLDTITRFYANIHEELPETFREDITTVPWYDPISAYGGGVYYDGYDLIEILSLEGDPLNGKSPKEALPILEEDVQPDPNYQPSAKRYMDGREFK